MCGLFGYVGRTPARRDVLLALAREAARRGPHAWGFVWIDGRGEVHEQKGTGTLLAHLDALDLVTDAYALIGQCRLTTSGTHRDARNNQPVRAGDVWVAHNGNIYNERALTRQYGWQRETENDSEALTLLIAQAPLFSPWQRVQTALVDVDARAPLAALVLTPDALVAVRRKGVDAPAHPLYWTGADDGAVVFCSRPMRGPGLHAPMLVLEGAHEEYAVRKGAVSA